MRRFKSLTSAPNHPQTQAKFERWHQSHKNHILLENYYLPGDPDRKNEDFVSHYNCRIYHECLNNLAPANVYFGRGQTILLETEKIKKKPQNNGAGSTREPLLLLKPQMSQMRH